MEKHLVVGADPFPPYQYIDEDGKIKGSDYEIIKNVLDDMGYEAEFIIREWPEIEKMFNAKKIDIVFQVQKTPEREKRYYFSEKLRDAVTVIVTSTNKTIKCNSLEELVHMIIKNKWKLGVMKGYHYGKIIDSIPKEYKVSFDTTEELLEAVNNDRVDLAVVDLGVFKYYKEKYGYSNLNIIENASFNRPLYVIFNDPSLRDEFNTYLRKYLKEHAG